MCTTVVHALRCGYSTPAKSNLGKVRAAEGHDRSDACRGGPSHRKGAEAPDEQSLVALAERGVRAEAEAREQLKVSYKRFLAENDTARKNEAGHDLIRAISGTNAIAEDPVRQSSSPVWQHLLQRVDERRISVADVLALQEWVKTGPAAPAGDWYKDFGSFMFVWHRPVPEDRIRERNEAVRLADRLITFPYAVDCDFGVAESSAERDPRPKSRALLGSRRPRPCTSERPDAGRRKQPSQRKPLTYDDHRSMVVVDARRSAQTDRCRTRNPMRALEPRPVHCAGGA